MERKNNDVLSALYAMARNDEAATPMRLAAHTGLSIAEVDEALQQLDQYNLARRDTCRLTLTGLAVAHRRQTGQPMRAPLAA